MLRSTKLVALLSCSLFFVACESGTSLSPEKTVGEDSLSSQALARVSSTSSKGQRGYVVTIENLTPDNGGGASQVFSPPVLATHNVSQHLFQVGELASESFAGLAEDALNGPVVAGLEGDSKVRMVVQGAGPIFPGTSASFEIMAAANAKSLSVAFMLVNTNDGFSGLDAIRLPKSGVRVYETPAYDAGSEANSELMTEIPGPCCGTSGAGVATSEPIHMHPGLSGEGDLDPAHWGWEGAVARITIRPMMPVYEVTVRNLTADNGGGASQVFSPPVIAAHLGGSTIFEVGELASSELAGLAEDALNGPVVASLHAMQRVSEVVEGGGPIFPGTSATYRVEGASLQSRLSMAFMLVNTNDGFSGLNSMKVPLHGSVSRMVYAYDAGSEANSELTTEIPGPCCGSPGAGVATSELISMHPGLSGTGDLDPAQWGWEGAVAEVIIQRVR